jgi:hypothetical protein
LKAAQRCQTLFPLGQMPEPIRETPMTHLLCHPPPGIVVTLYIVIYNYNIKM